MMAATSNSNWYVPLDPGAAQTFAPVMTEERACLETYFQCLGNFAFDKAKEVVEKCKDSQKSTPYSIWSQIVFSLSSLALAEKTYFSLAFLSSGLSIFGQKRDSIRTSYDTLSREFRRLDELVSRDGGKTFAPLEKQLAHLSSQLSDFAVARVKMMNYYNQMATMGEMKYVNFEDLLTVVADIMQSSQKMFHHPILGPLKSAFTTECDINNHLLQSQINMAIWQFLPSLLHLHEAHYKLAAWGREYQAKETKMLGFGSRQPVEPVLYTWLCKLRSMLVAKFSLYFYETLSRQTPAASADMKALTAKCTVDFYGKIAAFQRKTDAINISLVYDVDGIQDLYQGPGYHHPNKITEKPKGINSYPAIFSFPNEKPVAKWPNVIMLISARQVDGGFEKTIYFYDKKTDSTYYMARIEARITFVVIFDAKKAERDSYVQNFMTDISTSLRLSKLLLSLKTGTK